MFCFHSCSENLPSLLATASNTWGLLILTLLLGYGLVEVPRYVLRKTRFNHCTPVISGAKCRNMSQYSPGTDCYSIYYTCDTFVYVNMCLIHNVVDRSLWNASRRTYSLNHCYFSVSKLYFDMSEREEKFNEVVQV